MDADRIVTWAKAHNLTMIPVEHATPVTLKVESSMLKACELLQSSPTMYFDQLSCITGVDNGPEAGTLEVIYHLYSIPFNQSIALKVVLPRTGAEVESVTSVWKSANWLEREVFDMYGVHFKGHPDLRRILMPADWEGHPLLKDYVHQDTYRQIKISS